jgi:hypothetical protein
MLRDEPVKCTIGRVCGVECVWAVDDEAFLILVFEEEENDGV